MSEHLDDRLSALLDGRLDAADESAARAHVAECPACAAELHAVAATRSWLRALPAVDPPTDFYERMLGRGRHRVPVGLGVLAASAAAAIALASMSAPARRVKPTINPLVEDHVVSASLVDDPVAQLSPIVVPTTVFVSTSTTVPSP
jgi:anti-sigma factor RsiW